MSERPFGLSSFGRVFFSLLKKDLPRDEYEAFVKRWNTRYRTRTTSSRRSGENWTSSARRLRERAARDPDLARRSPFEQGFLGSAKQDLPTNEYAAFVKRWDRRKRERAQRRRSPRNR